jgi:transcriptional regulator with XRE-family HTH domain
MTTATDIDRHFGANVVAHRRQRGWPLRTLSEKSGVAYSHISGVERGVRAISLHHALSIATALDVSLATLCNEPEASQ